MKSHAHKTRRKAEDAVALAVAKLPTEQRAELLSGEAPAPSTGTRKVMKKPRKLPTKKARGKRK